MSQQINLYNPIFKQQKKILSAATMAQALALIALGVILLSSYVVYRTAQLASDAAAAAQQRDGANQRLVKVNAEFGPREKNRQLQQDIQDVENQMAAMKKVDAILHNSDLGNTSGYSSYMEAFARQIIDGVWLTGFSIHGDAIEIDLQGRALRPELVATYIKRLGSEASLQGKSFSTLEMHLPEPPKIADGKTADGKNTEPAVKPAPANYVEFSLQSAGAGKQAGDAAGAKTK